MTDTKPVMAPPVLEVTFKLERAGTLRKGSLVQAALHVHNAGSAGRPVAPGTIDVTVRRLSDGQFSLKSPVGSSDFSYALVL